jgi:hypothetical protein
VPFRCPECSIANSLYISASIELPPDSRSDEITLQIVTCRACRFEGLAVYEESRRGALDSESVDHRGYHASQGDVRELKRLIGDCPKPHDARCSCPTHRRLGRRNAAGRWNALDKLHHLGTFRMEL